MNNESSTPPDHELKRQAAEQWEAQGNFEEALVNYKESLLHLENDDPSHELSQDLEVKRIQLIEECKLKIQELESITNDIVDSTRTNGLIEEHNNVHTIEISEEQIAIEQGNFIMKVYGWMSFALIVSGFVAVLTVSIPIMTEVIIENRFVFMGLLIVELICVAYLVSIIEKISSQRATVIFIGYAVLNGLTFATIFLSFTVESIASTFFSTAGMFGVISIYGYYTKTNLTSIGNLAFMGLTGLIIASMTNVFLHNETVYWVSTYAGILIFVALTAYDTQKIKKINIIGNEGTEEDKKEAIIGALTLYLDFINLFILLLRLFGKRRFGSFDKPE